MNNDLIRRNDTFKSIANDGDEHWWYEERINEVPAVDAVEVKQIKAYLQSKLDEWNALGDRKFEPANMWGYNFIMACFDDLARTDGE